MSEEEKVKLCKRYKRDVDLTELLAVMWLLGAIGIVLNIRADNWITEFISCIITLIIYGGIYYLVVTILEKYSIVKIGDPASEVRTYELGGIIYYVCHITDYCLHRCEKAERASVNEKPFKIFTIPDIDNGINSPPKEESLYYLQLLNSRIELTSEQYRYLYKELSTSYCCVMMTIEEYGKCLNGSLSTLEEASLIKD